MAEYPLGTFWVRGQDLFVSARRLVCDALYLASGMLLSLVAVVPGLLLARNTIQGTVSRASIPTARLPSASRTEFGLEVLYGEFSATSSLEGPASGLGACVGGFDPEGRECVATSSPAPTRDRARLPT